MNEFYDRLAKIEAECSSDIMEKKVILLGVLKDFAPSFLLENKLLAKAVDEKVHLLFYKNADKDFHEKNQLVSKARWILEKEMYLREEAIETVIVSFMILAGWKDDYKIFLESEVAQEIAFREWNKNLENPYAAPEYFLKLGKCYHTGKGEKQDFEQAVYCFKKAAEQGDVEAQFWLGYCYNNGTGIEKDVNKAAKWYAQAANYGNADAQCNLGYCYYSGDGVEQDDNKALYWFERAAKQGQVKAQSWLGYCYAAGRGAKQNFQKAIEWYKKAAAQGDEFAQNKLDLLL